MQRLYKNLVCVSLIALALILASGFRACKKTDLPTGTVLQVYSQTRQITPRNRVMVASLSGVPDSFLDAVDDSMDQLRADIARNPLLNSHNIAPELVIIYALHTCTLSPESRTPSFRLRADDYDGSVFDQDPTPGVGVILAAEYVISDPAPGSRLGYVLANEWVICSVADGLPVGSLYVKRVSRYGQEHKYLFDWFTDEYDRTKNHSTGPGHPLIETDDTESLTPVEKLQGILTSAGPIIGRLKR